MRIDANAPFDPKTVHSEMIEFIQNHGFDYSLPLLIVSDVDSTFIKEEVIDLLAESAGTKFEVSQITESAMRGEIDFAESLKRRVRTLEGLSAETLQRVSGMINLSDGALTLLEHLKLKGHHFALVSGGFQQILEPLCKKLDIEFFAANTLEIIDNKLTGNIVGPIVDAEAKAEFLVALRQRLKIPPRNVIAIGDGANDLLMLKEASVSISFNGKPIVAKSCSISIDGPFIDHVLTLVY